MDDELLDLVNRDDQVIGTINRMDNQRRLDEELGYVRAVDLFILNQVGQIYIPTRTANKTIAPNGYDFSVGGHVGSGDSYATTLVRETLEELNLTIRLEDVTLIDKTTYEEVKYHRHLYLLKSDVEPEFNPDDFVAAQWLLPDEIIRQIDNGHPAKPSLRSSVLLLQRYLSNN